MKIGIIGAGQVGGTLARHLVRLGHEVSIANSRGPESLAAFAKEIGAKAVSASEAAKAGELVILAIPTKSVPLLSKDIFRNVSDKTVVIDTGNYHPALRDGHIAALEDGVLDSVWTSVHIGRPVIKAFNNILATSLDTKGLPKGSPGRIALSVAGDSSEAKSLVFRLIDDLGFDPVNGGTLDESWRQQTGTPAYCRDLDAQSLKHALAMADRNLIADYRAQRESEIKRMMQGK